MLHADARFGEAVRERVARLELQTDAEVVVVAAERSGSYRDVAMVIGGVAALGMFSALLAIPWHVHPVLAVADVALTMALVTWLVDGRAFVVRLASRARRAEQVRIAAAAEFHLEAVHATPRRTGLLVYVSAAEARIELVPDVGVEARVPRARWAEATAQLSATDLELFLRGLDGVGAILAERLPPAGERGVELSDAPRIRA
jgi:putative membrane protein